MISVQNLRDLINERLTAAAEEIFTEFEKTIVQYEEEIDRQRKLLDNIGKPQIKFHTTDLLQQHVQEENVLADQNLCNQERNSSLDQENPDSLEMKEEQEELCTSQEGEHLGLIQEADTLVQCKSGCAEISREIFLMSDNPVGRSDEEINQSLQPRLLDATWNPQIMLHRIDHPHQDVWRERNGLSHQQLCDHNREFHLDQEDPKLPQIKEEEENFITCLDQNDPEPAHIKEEQIEFCTNLHQKDPEPSQIKEEPEELCTSQHKEQIVLNQATDTFLLTSADQDGDHSEHSFRSDLKVNKGEKRYTCETCGKRFSYNSRLTVHMRTHTCSCRICGQSFSKRNHLTTHMRSHTGEKQFSCETCGKSFSRRHSLSVHMRLHTGEKPYSCETCGKGFFTNANLLSHLITHKSEKAYCCERCGKKFKRRSTLYIHMRNHTGETLLNIGETKLG